MEISQELQTAALEAFNKVSKKALQTMRQQKWNCTSVRCSFLFNGVVDYATYNVKKDKFESITIKVAKGNKSRMFFDDTPAKVGEGVYSEECEYVEIPV